MKLFYQGGLGNQLFQYAFGQYLRRKKHKIVFSDVFLKKNFYNVTKRKYQLDYLEDRLTSNYLDILYMGVHQKILSKSTKIYIERDPKEDAEAIINHKTSHLLGYFQTSFYIDQIWESDSAKFKAWLRRPAYLPEKYSVIHLRFKDYQNPENKLIFGSLTKDYFLKILTRREFSNVKDLYVVSDSPLEAEILILSLDIPHLNIILKDSDEIEHFRILAHSNLTVLSNSSFSWWGGYLSNKFTNSLVFAPTPWFVNSWQTHKSFYPKEWILVDRK